MDDCDKMPDKSDLTKEGFLLAQTWRAPSITVGKAWRQNQLVTLCLLSKSWEGWMLMSSSILLFLSSSEPQGVIRCCCPRSWWVLLISRPFLGIPSWAHCGVCFHGDSKANAVDRITHHRVGQREFEICQKKGGVVPEELPQHREQAGDLVPCWELHTGFLKGAAPVLDTGPSVFPGKLFRC